MNEKSDTGAVEWRCDQKVDFDENDWRPPGDVVKVDGDSQIWTGEVKAKRKEHPAKVGLESECMHLCSEELMHSDPEVLWRGVRWVEVAEERT